MTSQPINILDLLNPVEVADQADSTLQPNSEIPRFGSKDAATVIKSFSDYSGKSRTEAIAHASQLSTDGCLYTVRATGSGGYKQEWEVCKGYYFGSLINYHNGKEVKDRAHLEAAAIATYKDLYGADAQAEFLPVLGWDELKNLMTRLPSGNCTAQEVIDDWGRFKQSMDALYLEFNQLTKTQLSERFGLRSDLQKPRMIESVIDHFRDRFHPHWYEQGGKSYGHGEDEFELIELRIHEWSDELTQRVAEARRKKQEERQAYLKKAATNPETMQEFDTFFHRMGEEALTTELRARYDKLVADLGIQSRFEKKVKRSTAEEFKLPEGAEFSEIIETSHTRDGYDLWVVQLNIRIDDEPFQALRKRAQQIGGKWSSYTKNGAVPGFQFKSREQAEAFRSLERIDGEGRVLERLEGKMDRASDRVTLHQGVVQDLPQSPFNAATSLLVMHFLPDDGTKLDYLQAIAARLQSGSPFVLVDMQGDKQSEEFERLVDGWQTRAKMAGMEAERLAELRSKTHQHLPCIPESRTLALLEQAGFRGVTRFYTGFVFTGWLAFLQ